MTDHARKGWVKASVRIFSDSVTVEWITVQLGIEPDIGGNAGEPGPGRSTRQRTLWSLKRGLSDDHLLNDHINQLLARLEGHHPALATIAEQCQLEIFAGVFSDGGQAGETLPWQTLKSLADYKIDLALDLYPVARRANTSRFRT